jgi:hypothetical protein
MGGWTKAKRLEVEAAFYAFLNQCYVNSKDNGRICLGECLYDGQIKFITETFDALERDVHKIFVLKSRQLGISTIARALTIFLLGIYDGFKGAVVFDTDGNKNEARSEIEVMIDDLPPSLEFPAIKQNNRTGLSLTNDSKVLFMSGGVKKSKSSGTLGRSVGLSFATLSELCSIDNDEGLEAFDNSLSEVNPDRLFVYESTARGFNSWWSMWKEARADTRHCHCIFLGWWSKPSQRIDRTRPDFEVYGVQSPTDREIKKINEVRELYGHEITVEQLAWVRRKMDPGAKSEGDSPIEYEGDTLRLQEQPWTEEDAFQMTGSVFFTPEKLTEQANRNVSKDYKTYMFNCGIEFTDMRVYKPPNNKSIELKVWEPPQQESVYVIAADPAFGSHEDNDRSAIQVLRCYADGCDQVAEYAWPLIGTRPFGWVMLALAGWYAKEQSDVYLIVELNGPGGAVWDEIVATRQHINAGYQPHEMEDKGLSNIFWNVKNYVYSRPDSLSSGKALQWKTAGGAGPAGKVRLMERLRDFTDNGMFKIRSQETLEEMRSVTRDGDTIAAQGKNKDDRVMSCALGIRCWEERVRRTLSVSQRTRERELAKLRLTPEDRYKMFTSYQFQQFLGEKKMIRDREARALRAHNRRFGRR